MPLRSQAQDFEAARAAFTDAKAAFDAAHYKAAATYFQRAYDVVKDPLLLYNIGDSWEKAGDGKQAVAAFRAYLVAQPAASDHAEVGRRVQQILARHYVIPKRSAPGDEIPPAVVAAPVRPTPSPVVVAKPAPPVVVRTEPEPVAPMPAIVSTTIDRKPLDQPVRTPTRRPLWAGAWATFGIAVAALGAGVGMQVVAKSRSDSLADQQSFVGANGQPHVYDAVQQRAYDDARSEGRTFQYAAIGCFAGAGVLAITSAVLFGLDSRRARPASAMQFLPSVGRQSAAANFSWSF